MASAPRCLIHRFRVRELKRALSPEVTAGSANIAVVNPFLPQFNEETGHWAPPRYSLRRQADLIKRGKMGDVLHLLPPGPKLNPSEIRTPTLTTKPKRASRKKKAVEGRDKPTIDITAPIKWIGEVKIRDVSGADVGNRLYAGKKQMFKGHKWERIAKMRRYHQRALMRSMKKRILRWRLVSAALQIIHVRITYLYRVQHYLKKGPWPLSRIRKGKAKKLPF